MSKVHAKYGRQTRPNKHLLNKYVLPRKNSVTKMAPVFKCLSKTECLNYMQYYCESIWCICIPEWKSSLGCKRQEIHAQSTLIQRCQNVSARAKVKRTFPGFENKNLLVITRKFFKLKKTWWFRAVADGIPSESESVLYERRIILTPNWVFGLSILLTQN